MEVFEKQAFPVAEVPDGEGWTLVTGNRTTNLWRRPGPVLAALTALMDWTRTHARLDGPDGASAVLMVAAEAVDQAIAEEIGRD